jgi:hypothetical protein
LAARQVMRSLWRRLPTIVRAVMAGLAVLVAGTILWGGVAGYPFLAGWNLRVFPGVPWAVVPMALYLWLYWRHLDGAGWPRTTAEDGPAHPCQRINLPPLSTGLNGVARKAAMGLDGRPLEFGAQSELS